MASSATRGSGGPSPPSTLKHEDQALVTAFNSHFGTVVSDPHIVKKLLGSLHVRGWYEEYRRERAEAAALPSHWAEVGLTSDLWLTAQSHTAAIRQARAGLAATASALAEQFDRDLRAAEAACQSQVAPHMTPVVRVVLAGYEDLPLDAQVRVESAAAESRAATLDAELKAWRIRAVAEVKAGRDPFRP